MPQKDRTFTEKDVLRIITNNLDPNEREAVIIALCANVTILDFGEGPFIAPLSVEEEALVDVPFIENVVEVIVAFFSGGLPIFLADLLFSKKNLQGLTRILQRTTIKN